MKIHLKLKTPEGGYKFVRCQCCGEKRSFKSWKAAEEYAKGNESTNWKAKRV